MGTAEFKEKFGNSGVLIKTLWPEKRLIPEWQMRVWYADAIANGETECEADGSPMTDELDWVIQQMSGLFTFAKDTYHHDI